QRTSPHPTSDPHQYGRAVVGGDVRWRCLDLEEGVDDLVQRPVAELHHPVDQYRLAAAGAQEVRQSIGEEEEEVLLRHPGYGRLVIAVRIDHAEGWIGDAQTTRLTVTRDTEGVGVAGVGVGE